MEEVIFEFGALKFGRKEGKHISGRENCMCKGSEAWQGHGCWTSGMTGGQDGVARGGSGGEDSGKVGRTG